MWAEGNCLFGPDDNCYAGRSLDGIGSNIYVVGLDDLTSLYNSSSPIVENEWNCSSGDL